MSDVRLKSVADDSKEDRDGSWSLLAGLLMTPFCYVVIPFMGLII